MSTRRRFCTLSSIGLVGFITGCGDRAIDSETSADTDADPGTTAPDETTAGPGDTDGETTGVDPSDADTSDTDASTDTSFACEPSPGSIEGPFYRPDIPVGGALDLHGDPGVSIRLSGQVLDTDCAPIAGAIVELWHATPVLPDGAPGDVDATYDDTEEYRYYGQVATDAEGRYAFTTLKPGWYLNGPQYRPAHLHLKVWIGASERLTTQVYFAGDPFNDIDTWYDPRMEIDPDDDGAATLDITVK
ncbi:MAG: hypothetical protein KC636_11670 [Myxococcales bacterium]|nr:hypothetical protein [Myxococcales bacterium]